MSTGRSSRSHAPSGGRSPGILAEDYMAVRPGPIWLALKGEPIFFWFFCGIIFVEYVRPQEIYEELSALRLGLLFLAGSVIFRLFAKERVSISSPLTPLLFALLFVVILSSALSYYPNIAFEHVRDVINWVVVVLLFVLVVTTRFRFFIVMLLFLLASFKMAQTGARTGIARGFAYEAWGVGGPGWFGNAADLGVQMAIFTPLAIVFILGCRPYWGKIKLAFFTLFPLAAIACAIATNQRSTLLAFLAMGFLAIAKSRQRIRALAVLVVVGIAGFMIMPPEYKDRILMAGSPEDTTSQSRLRYWQAGLETFTEHPVLGIGHFNWGPYMWEYRPGLSLRANVQEVAHSAPVTVLTELGATGFTLYYSLVLVAVILNRRSQRRFSEANEPFWAYMATGLNFGFVAYLVTGVFLSIAWYPFLFMQLGFSAALYRLSSDIQPQRPANAVTESVNNGNQTRLRRPRGTPTLLAGRPGR